MLLNRFIGLFHKRCPLCKQEVHEQGGEVVQRLGKWFCTEVHADRYEWELYEALHTVHCRHVGCHGQYVPLPEAVDMDGALGDNLERGRLRERRGRCVTHLAYPRCSKSGFAGLPKGQCSQGAYEVTASEKEQYR
jgi:hypothetical protein